MAQLTLPTYYIICLLSLMGEWGEGGRAYSSHCHLAPPNQVRHCDDLADKEMVCWLGQCDLIGSSGFVPQFQLSLQRSPRLLCRDDMEGGWEVAVFFLLWVFAFKVCHLCSPFFPFYKSEQ